MYSIEAPDNSELMAAHWHPDGKSQHKKPHLHLSQNVVSQEGGFLAREPLYTGRFTFEAMIRLTVRNLGVKPVCEDWENRLLLAETPHMLYRSWHQTPAEASDQ